MASTNMTLGGGVAQSDQAAPGSSSSSNSLPASNSSLKELALNARQVMCVSYTDLDSVGGNSLIDLQVGYAHKVVSSGQTRLNAAANDSLVVVRSKTHAVVGVIGDRIPTCTLWADRGGKKFKYSRQFTPLTGIFPIDSIRDKWRAICELHNVEKNPQLLFHPTYCDATAYVPALHDALRLDYFPIRTSMFGTHMTFA